MIHHDINLLYQFWIHTEAIHQLPKPLEFILNTPSHHRVHHGRNPHCIDTNYAGVLIIWDRLCGTFEPEVKPDTKLVSESLNKTGIAYGLMHNLRSFSPAVVQLHHHKYVLSTLAFTKLNYAKFKFFMFGPGYDGTEDCPRLGKHENLPEPECPIKFLENEKFEHGNWRIKIFVLLQMLTPFILGEKAYKLADATALTSKLVYIAVFILQV